MTKSTEQAKAWTDECLQRAAYQISDLTKAWERREMVFLCAAMFSSALAIRNSLPDIDKQVFDTITTNTKVIIMPPELDPRRRETEK